LFEFAVTLFSSFLPSFVKETDFEPAAMLTRSSRLAVDRGVVPAAEPADGKSEHANPGPPTLYPENLGLAAIAEISKSPQPSQQQLDSAPFFT